MVASDVPQHKKEMLAASHSCCLLGIWEGLRDKSGRSRPSSWLAYPRIIKARANLTYTSPRQTMMQWTRAARDAHGPNFLLFPEPASFSASEYRRGDTMLTSPFQGQWDSSTATLPWPRACSLPSVWLLGSSTPSHSQPSPGLQSREHQPSGSTPGTRPPVFHHWAPSPPPSHPKWIVPPKPQAPSVHTLIVPLGVGSWLYIQTPQSLGKHWGNRTVAHREMEWSTQVRYKGGSNRQVGGSRALKATP